MIIQGMFLFNYRPMNGAIAKLWPASVLGAPPALDDDEPVSGQVGDTLRTGVEYGSSGSFRWVNMTSQAYYVSVEYDGHRAWLFFDHVNVNRILTTQGDMLIAGSTTLERKAKGSEGQKLRIIGGIPTWA